MMRKELIVKSSDGVSTYTVVFDWNSKDLFVTCTCKAGMQGDYCKHKGALIDGDPSLLSIDEDISELLHWVNASSVGVALSRWREAEENMKSAQAAAKSAKKKLADLINPRRVR